MKTVVLTPLATKPARMAEESREKCYFPGCRKDTNCNCEICLASINATLDLMPSSVQRSSITKSSTFSLSPEKSRASSDPMIPLTPKSDIRLPSASLLVNSTAKSRPIVDRKKMIAENNKNCVGLRKLFVCLILMIIVAEYGVPWAISVFCEPALSLDTVKGIVEEAQGRNNLKEKLELLQRRLEDIVQAKVFNCSSDDHIWKLKQDALLFHSRCFIYKSASEEVSIWGWHLQTSVLVPAGISSRSFTILSGRVTERSSGKTTFSIKAQNSSWTLQKGTSTTLQLDPNTWIVEYRRSPILENIGLLSTTSKLIKLEIPELFRDLEKLLLMPDFSQKIISYHRQDDDDYRHPT